MNRLALGTVQFGLPYGVANKIGKVSLPESKAMLEFAKNNGVDMIDTAISYGDSETSLGVLGTDSFRLVTKLPGMPENQIDIDAWVDLQLRESFLRLGVDNIYGLLFHGTNQLLSQNGSKLYEAILKFKENGMVKKLGVSIYSPKELESIIPHYNFDLIQAPFNLIDRRLSSSGWLKRLKDMNVEIHTRSVFLQGLLLMKQKDIPYKFSAWNEIWLKWHSWLIGQEHSAIEACLAFPLSFPEIDRVVVGSESLSQLTQIVQALDNLSVQNLPYLKSDDEKLINPVNWEAL